MRDACEMCDRHGRRVGLKLSPTLIGTLCGAGAALFWASALVAARHGVAIGLSPVDIAFHRFFWVGLCFLPFMRKGGVADLAGGG